MSDDCHPRWISVNDGFPEPRKMVLTCDVESGLQSTAAWFPEMDDGRGQWLEEGAVTVTHWQPLPDLPRSFRKICPMCGCKLLRIIRFCGKVFCRCNNSQCRYESS